MLSRARSSGVVVLVGLGEYPVDALRENTALRLHVAVDGAITSDDGGVWSISR